MRAAFALAFLGILLETGCQPEIVPTPYIPSSAYDAYRHSLETAGLSDSALARDWMSVGEAALRSPMSIEAPFEESLYIDDASAFAAGFRFSVPRGRRTEIVLSVQTASDWRIFMDLFRIPPQGDAPVHVASAGEGDRRLSFEPRRDGVYVLRVQSELLRGGAASLRIRNVAALDFPVSGADTASIGSTFGVPREGGRRQHHGVDIFAPRHTPVLATSRARVRRVADWKLGGHVIWLEDPERRLRLYFAHLQTQEVEEGMWVAPGERIGTVGNSGNARTTPPHLHFGIYVRGEGPIDPFPFLVQPRRKPEKVDVDLEKLGRWIRTRRDPVSLLAEPRGRDVIVDVPAHTPVLVWGGSGKRFRVALPNGTHGYLRERSTEPADAAVDVLELPEPTAVLDEPRADAAIKRKLPAGTTIDVLARYEEFAWVREDDASAGAPAALPREEPEWVRPAFIDPTP